MSGDLAAFLRARTCSVDGCDRTGKLTRGMCAKCYSYWITHVPIDQRPIAPRFVDDFWDQVWKSHEHGCWLWTGSTDRNDYGRWKRHLAHREAWQRDNGPIENGRVNPKHLYLGTVSQNAIDASVRGQIARVNAAKTHCPKGHPYTGGNLYVVPRNGHRQCKECNRVRAREHQRQKRGANRGAA